MSFVEEDQMRIDSPPAKVVREMRQDGIYFTFTWKIPGQSGNALNIMLLVSREEVENASHISELSDAFLTAAYKEIDNQPVEIHNILIDDFQRFAMHYDWDRVLLSGPQ